MRLAGEAPRLLEPVDADVGDLALAGVRADGLAEVRLRALDVEDVVDDLEEQAELAGEAAQRARRRPARGAPARARSAPRTAIRRPVFRAWTRRSASGDSLPASFRSRYWPPTIPPRPVARLISREDPDARARRRPGWCSATSCTASAKRASPARMAVSSPKSTWQVGRPRRRSSSSIAGRSSWISE